MNILFLEGDMSRSGGTERMTARLSACFSRNHAVHIISLKQTFGKGIFFPLAEGVAHTVLRDGNMVQQIKEIHGYIRRHEIDVVINVDTGMGIYGILAAKFTKAKVITWEHSNFLNNWGSRAFPYLRKIAAQHSDAVVVLTERDRKNYEQGLTRCAPVSVIPNPVQRNTYAYEQQAKTILSAGLFGEIKRFDLIPEIGKEIFSRHPDWQWVICGDGPEREKVQDLIRTYGLEKNIKLPGKVTNMDDYYRHAAMYVMTSRMEGLPMVLLEAKSYGLPLVSFDIMTGPSDIIRDGVNGYLVKDNDISEMTARVLALMENDALRQSFSDHADLDMDKFSEETAVEKWEQLISSL